MKFALVSTAAFALFALSDGRQCGRHTDSLLDVNTFIVGGDDVGISDSVVSFQVFKGDALSSTFQWKHVCGGTLLNSRWVLTAANCVKGFRDWGAARVSVGSSKLADSPTAQRIKVRRVHEWPSWRQPSRDVALVELQRPVRLNPNISPACLNAYRDDTMEEESCAVLGWGRTGETADLSDTLKVVQVDIIPEEQCRRAVGGTVGAGITFAHVCAGNLGERDRGICAGDLGGPLYCKTHNGIELVGVAADGAECGDAQRPGIYVRTASIIDWIRQTTGDKSIGEVEAVSTDNPIYYMQKRK